MAFYDLIELSGIWWHGIPLGLGECGFLHINAALPDVLVDCDALPILVDYGEPLPVDALTPVIEHDAFNGEIVIVCP